MGFDLPLQSSIKNKLKGPIVPDIPPTFAPRPVYETPFGTEPERETWQRAGESRIREVGQSVSDIGTGLGEGTYQQAHSTYVDGQYSLPSHGLPLFNDPSVARKFGAGLFDVAASFVSEAASAIHRETIQAFGSQGLTPGGRPNLNNVGLITGHTFGPLIDHDHKTEAQIAAQQPFQSGFAETLGEHITSPWYVRYPTEVVADPWNLAGGAVGGTIKGVRAGWRATQGLRGVSKVPVKAHADVLIDRVDRIAHNQGLDAEYVPSNFDNFRTLEEFGLEPIAANNKFAAPLLPFNDALSDVVTNTSISGVLAAKSGSNPGVLRQTPVGRALTAFQRQIAASESLVDTTIASVIDSRTRRGAATIGGVEVPAPGLGTGNIDHLLPIDENGFFRGTGALWQDVFSKPSDPRWRNVLSPETRQLIDDYNWVTNVEIPRILEDAGIDLRKASRPDYEYYVPRDVQEIRGIETRRQSQPALNRHYEEATEGFSEGVRYNIDPRDTLSLHLRWAYRKAAKKQFDDHLEPLSLTGREIVPQGIRDNYSLSMIRVRAVEQQRRRIRKGIVTAESTLRRLDERVAGRQSTSSMLNRDVGELDDIITNLGEVQLTTPSGLHVKATNASVNKSRRAWESLVRSVAKAEDALTRARTQTEGTTTLQSNLSTELGKLEAEISRIEMAPHLRELTLDELDDAASYAASADSARWHQLTGRLKQAQKTGRGLAIRLEASEQRLIRLEDVRDRLEFVRDEAILRRDLASVDLKLASRSLVEASQQHNKVLKDAGRWAGSMKVAKVVLGRRQVHERRVARSLGTAERNREDVQVRLNILKDVLSAVDAKLPEVKAFYTKSQKAFTDAVGEAKQAEKSAGNLWGPNQPDEIPIAEWRKRFFRREDADLLKSVMRTADVRGEDVPAAIGKPIRVVEILGNTIRTMAATGDFAMPFIHGLLVLSENPPAWGRMLLRHHQAFFDPSVQARLIRDNLTDFQWLARHGVPIGDPEFFAALKQGEGISADMLFGKMPRGEEARRFLRLGGRQTFGRFQASYNTGLGWARVLLLQGLRDTWKGTDAELAHYIRNLTGGLDSRALGVSPSQRSAEGIWMAFSPRLLRSTMSLVWDAFNPVAAAATRGVGPVGFSPDSRWRVQPTEVGRKSFRNLTRLAMGATLVYTLTGMAMRKDWDEIGAGLNPLNGKRFLSHQVNGDWLGVGGQIRAITQLMAGMSIGLITEPASLVTLDRFENPLIKFLTSRGAPGLELVGATAEAASGGKWDALPYDEVDGLVDLIRHVGTSFTFFGVQGAIEGEKGLTVTGSVLGLRTSAETVFEKRNKARDIVTEKLYPGRKYNADYPEGLDRGERAVVDADPTVIKAMEVVALKQTEKNAKIQLYKNAIQKAKDDASNLIAGAATQLNEGEEFRIQRKRIYGLLSRDLGEIKDDPKHKEAQEFLDEMEPRTGPVDVATRDLYDTIESERSQLENPYTNEYDMEHHDRLMDGLRRKHGDDVIDEVLRLNQEGEHPFETQLRKDRKTLESWFAVSREVVQRIPENLIMPDGANGRQIWVDYQDGSHKERTDLQIRYGKFIRYVQDKVRDAREVIEMHPTQGYEVRKALLRQDYGPRPKTMEGFNDLQKYVNP